MRSRILRCIMDIFMSPTAYIFIRHKFTVYIVREKINKFSCTCQMYSGSTKMGRVLNTEILCTSFISYFSSIELHLCFIKITVHFSVFILRCMFIKNDLYKTEL